MPLNWVPNTAVTTAESHDGHFDFLQATPEVCLIFVARRHYKSVIAGMPHLADRR
jgi:hypothetical protein